MAGQASNTEHRTKAGKIYYGLALLFFALGLMSKPMVVTLPFVMLLLDYWPLQRGLRGEGRGEKADAAGLSPLTSHLSPPNSHLSPPVIHLPPPPINKPMKN